MKPVWALINCHDRARFEVHMFSDGGNPSADSGYRDRPDDNIHVIRGRTSLWPGPSPMRASTYWSI
jgi:protein O-GlcNAc transferase